MGFNDLWDNIKTLIFLLLESKKEEKNSRGKYTWRNNGCKFPKFAKRCKFPDEETQKVLKETFKKDHTQTA